MVEANVHDEAEKNMLCAPIAPPTMPRDWLKMMIVELANRDLWREHPVVTRFLEQSRLSGGFQQNLASLTPEDTEIWADLDRYLGAAGPAAANARRLLGS